MTSARAALERLCDPSAEVSAHYLIGGDGTLWQMVREEDRAWHAGQGSWQGRDDINSRSIGIELDNRGTHPFAAPQMAALDGLLAGILARWSIPPAGVIGHSDMAPGRKQDPGHRFDWARLERMGLAAKARQTPADTADWPRFRAEAAAMGYPTDVDDSALLRAIRDRHRPHGYGPLSPDDMGFSAR